MVCLGLEVASLLLAEQAGDGTTTLKVSFTFMSDSWSCHAQDPLANAPLEAKVKSIERYLGADLVQFRIQEAAEQLMREGRSVHAMADEHSFHVDQTGTVYHGIQWQ